MTMQILLCSTSPAVAEAVAAITVGGQPCRPTVCESGLDLLGAVRQVPADLVILDLDTAGINPSFLIGAIAEVAPGLPVAAVSTRTDVDVPALTIRGVPYIRLNGNPAVEVRALLGDLDRRHRAARRVVAAPR